MISLIPGRFGSSSVSGICVMGVDFTLCFISSCWLGMEKAPSLYVCPELFCQWVCGFRKLGPLFLARLSQWATPALWPLKLVPRPVRCWYWGSLALLGNIHFWS